MSSSRPSVQSMLFNQKQVKKELDKIEQIRELQKKIIALEVQGKKIEDSIIELRTQLLLLTEDQSETPKARL